VAIKKSDLYSSIWAACDQLRGGMDASQYKDYVLFMLFIKYVTDKYAESDDFEPPVTIPKGASFKDMIALKGKPDIGERINVDVIGPLVRANTGLARSDFPLRARRHSRDRQRIGLRHVGGGRCRVLH
jgi:type I restriction enzyme M protein